MQNSFGVIWERIRFKISDSLSANKTYYIVYFLFLIIGTVLGVVAGKDIPELYDVDITNRITVILYENGGIFSAFLSDVWTFVLIYGLCVFFAFNYPFALALIPICAFVAFKTMRNAVCLIVIGGFENIACAIIFNIIYYLLFLFLLSYTVVKTIKWARITRYCRMNLFSVIKYVTPSYLLCLIIVVIYSALFSFLISLFAI